MNGKYEMASVIYIIIRCRMGRDFTRSGYLAVTTWLDLGIKYVTCDIAFLWHVCVIHCCFLIMSL